MQFRLFPLDFRVQVSKFCPNCEYIYIYIYCHGLKNHTTRTVPIMAPEGGFIDTQVTNRCKGALVQSVFSSSVLVQGACACAQLWLSGHTLLSAGVKKRERDVSGSLSGGQDSPFSARSAELIMLPADDLQLGPISRH